MENLIVDIRREVIRSQLEHLASMLSKEGEESFIITACVVDGRSHLFGSSKGIEYIQKYFKGVVKEFLPYLRQQEMSESVCTPKVVDDIYNGRKAIRSVIEYLTCRLSENGEECFVVTATNPNILGSDKGIVYCRIWFQGIQRAFSRHVDQINIEAHQTVERDQKIEQGPETSTEDGRSVHRELTPVKLENPSRHESENEQCGINPNAKQEPYPTPRKDESRAPSRNVTTYQWNDRGKQPIKDKNTPTNIDIQSMSYSDDSDLELLGIGTDEDSTDADSLLSDSKPLAKPSNWETTGSKRTYQTDEVNSDIKRFKAATPSSKESIFKHTKITVDSLPDINQSINLNIVFPNTSGEQSTKQVNKEDKRFVCVVKGCEKSHTTRRQQLEHYTSHTDNKLYICDLCGMSFKNRTSVNYHMKHKHPDTEYKPQHILKKPLEDLEKELERHNDVSTSYNPDETLNENMPKQSNMFCGVHFPGLHDDQDSVP